METQDSSQSTATSEQGIEPPKKSSKKKLWIVIAAAFLILAGVAFFVIRKGEEPTDDKGVSTSTPADENSVVAKVTIPESILNNKFGFLSAGPGDGEFITGVGGGWVRPHPGAFVWERSQSSADAEYYYSISDKEVARYQKDNVAILATIWPFADWDQMNNPKASSCAVSSNDEFAPGGEDSKKGSKPGLDEETYGRGYLPLQRCAPTDWIAYKKWITAMVERYDGDGIKDMAGLTMPIKHWEVMNEPDLSSPDGIDRLKFWKDTPEAYGTLLINTSEAIKAADSEAKVVIAGAAGGNNNFIGFYRSVFANADTIAAFDYANVHCITSDSIDSFNVEPYKRLLAEFNINKPIWVTEAEALISSDPDINATQILASTRKAIELGAAKIFYTRYEFTNQENMMTPRGFTAPTAKTVDGSDPEAGYKNIIGQF
ncbi:MAG: hypothetical protein WC227_02265 [Patescibacteria group bacterium]|jgi:hypothetical protein